MTMTMMMTTMMLMMMKMMMMLLLLLMMMMMMMMTMMMMIIGTPTDASGAWTRAAAAERARASGRRRRAGIRVPARVPASGASLKAGVRRSFVALGSIPRLVGNGLPGHVARAPPRSGSNRRPTASRSMPLPTWTRRPFRFGLSGPAFFRVVFRGRFINVD